MRIAQIGAANALAIVILCGSSASAQAETFAARLSIVPITIAMQKVITGRGSATAVLAGDTLTVDGTFEGLRSPATVARLHMGVRGVRGPSIANLVVSNGTSGSIKGVVTLNRDLRQALEKSALYIQIHSEKAPEGNLWGWLLPQEVKP